MDENYLAKKIPYEVLIPTKINDYKKIINDNDESDITYRKIKTVGLGKYRTIIMNEDGDF